MRRIWLASFPKSGNTWMRMLIAGLSGDEGAAFDLNDMPVRDGIASARGRFDETLLIPSGLLSHDECDALRPCLYEATAQNEVDAGEDEATFAQLRFTKVHDAYSYTATGEPLLAGARGADGAILIVRDPRDVAPSFAHHNGSTIDGAIARMADRQGALSSRTDRQNSQLRQRLGGWSGHAESWLTQDDIPILLVHYEAMKADTAAVLRRVLDFVQHTVSDEIIARAVALTDFATLQQREAESGFREAPRPGQGGHRFFRRGEVGVWPDELTAGQVAAIEAEHAPMMQQLGYRLSGECEQARAG